MVIFAIFLQLLACIAVIVFILYTVNVHKRITKYIKRVENILNDHQVYLTKEIEFRNSISKTIDKCTNLLTLCNNTNLEVVSKLRYSNKNRDNKFNVIIDKFKYNTGIIEDAHNMLLDIHNEIKNKVNNSYTKCQTYNNSSSNDKCDIKLKTAINKHFTRENGINKKTKKKK